ncbi:hypothetical protein DFH06DRAFT_1147857 [Mycena polygramma]|nr:hypothetical protein DFH06DRAFT_1147857 [Mycena polygramma]
MSTMEPSVVIAGARELKMVFIYQDTETRTLKLGVARTTTTLSLRCWVADSVGPELCLCCIHYWARQNKQHLASPSCSVHGTAHPPNVSSCAEVLQFLMNRNFRYVQRREDDESALGKANYTYLGSTDHSFESYTRRVNGASLTQPPPSVQRHEVMQQPPAEGGPEKIAWDVPLDHFGARTPDTARSEKVDFGPGSGPICLLLADSG